ncbi:sulfotransferase family protein [Nonomuraea sp. NPDC050478]|uniref:sulfotransferase family protein n=1 Tax=Nonomuraea sp. NPDC050478 TaxID=3364365 RepID=UPI0037B8FD94
MTMPLPDFLVIGAPKAGTTALHAALREHPGLYLPPVKEPKFFLTDGPPPDRGGPGDQQTYREHVWRRADYEALFAAAPPGAARGEATPFYLYDLDAQRRIHAAIPHARLIAILRDPVERAHSNWTHLWSAGLEPIGDVVRACAAEERRVADGWAHFWHYVRLGRYGEQLAHLFTLFPREQVLVFRYRDLVDRPAHTLDRICAFLGVDQGLLTEAPRENVTAHPDAGGRHLLLSAALRALARTGRALPYGLARALTEPVEHLLQRRSAARRPLTWEQRQQLIPRFADDIELLQRVTGEDFGDWVRPRERSGGQFGVRPDGQRQARNGRPLIG